MTTLFPDVPVRTARRTISSVLVWTCGVILPAAAILFEAVTAICSDFVDPMPTLWHLGLLICVPVCNALAWWGLKRDELPSGPWLAALTGFSGVIALFYTILFAPILPIAAIGLIVILPVLAFAPALALLTSVKLMRNWAGLVGWRPVGTGAVCGAVALVLAAWPAVGARAGAGLARSQDPWLRDFGYYLLRLDGVRQELLYACHSRGAGGAVESVAWITGRGPLTWAEARPLYYRVTGRSYEQEPKAALAWKHRAHPWFDEFRGGDRVGPKSDGVGLASSRLDGSVDARAAVAYFEWTMVFRNTSPTQQEARTEIALPKSAVVSRATLWIHGAEREAAFGERAQVRQAYESVVRMRRDPLLVTSSGPDRVLVQCFPIEPAGEMKIRIGVTAPVSPDGTVSLPQLLTRNFDTAEPSWLWIESRSPIAEGERREDGVYMLRRKVPPAERTVVRLDNVKLSPVFAPESNDQVVEQRFVEHTVQPPKRIGVVVDGSESMRPVREDIQSALATMPSTVEARVIVAGRSGLMPITSRDEWRGGIDAVPALESALPGPILWIAGDQPVTFAGTEQIRQALQRGRGETKLYVLAAAGSNVILRELEGLPGVEMVARTASIGADLRHFLTRLREPYQEQVRELKLLPAAGVSKDAEPGSQHIVRLWAAAQSANLAERHRGEAVALAVAHQIVTPLSGAVVLETARQFQQNGLEPAKPSTVPTMPEPETYALMAIALAVLVVTWWGGRFRLPECGREHLPCAK